MSSLIYRWNIGLVLAVLCVLSGCDRPASTAPSAEGAVDTGGLLLEYQADENDFSHCVATGEVPTVVGSLTRIVSENSSGDVGLSLTEVHRFHGSAIKNWKHPIVGVASGRWLLKVEIEVEESENPDISDSRLILNKVCEVAIGTTIAIPLHPYASAVWTPIFVEDGGYLGGFAYYIRPFGEQSWRKLKTPEPNVLFSEAPYAPGHYQLMVSGADVQVVALEPRETKQDRVVITRQGDLTNLRLVPVEE